MPQNSYSGPKLEKEEISQFNELFEEHQHDLYQYLRYLCGEPTMADDLYQETWCRIAQHIARKKEIRTFKNFLFAIATNLFRDEMRKKKLQSFFLGATQSIEEIPEHATARQEQDQDFEIDFADALQKLSEKQRIMFSLAHIQGFKIREISKLCGCAEGTAKATIHRAAKKLASELKNA